MRQTVRVKRSHRGWFAAGAGIERALGELNDTAFKVFVHVCLRAERASGCLEFQRRELARAVGKSRSTLGRCLRELAGKGVCELEAAANQHGVSRLRVRPEYWPYEVQEARVREQQPAQRAGPGTAGKASAYVTQVRRMFCRPACVQGRFGAADERLAAAWQRAGRAAGDGAAGDPAGQRAQVHELARPPGRRAGAEPALLHGPAGGGAHRVVPGFLLGAPRVQPEPLREAVAEPAC